ncbi:Phosphatidylinositol phosphate synthase [Stackebrandtia soli]
MGEMAKFLNVAGRAAAAKVLDPIGAGLVRLGLAPNVITLIGTTGVVAGCVFLVARGQLAWGLVVVALAVCTDLLDGAMARAKGVSSRFGAMLDSTMDRIADGAIFASLAYWLAVSGDRSSAVAALICLVAAEVVSYTKARAESLGASCDVGIAERPERLILIGIGALIHIVGVPYAMAVTLWLLAVMSVVTVAQRVLHVRRQLSEDVDPDNA